MDNRITRKRLNDHLSYDWIKYIAIILAAILLWSLVTTMMKPRVPNKMIFEMFAVVPGMLDSERTQVATDLADKTLDKNLIKQSQVDLWQLGGQATSQLITTRMSTQQGDIFIMDDGNFRGETEKDRVGNIRAYVDNGVFYSLTETLRDIAEMQFDEAAFRARTKQEHKFNKVDTESDMQAAIVAEKARIESLKAEAVKLQGYLVTIPGLAFEYRRGDQNAISGGAENTLETTTEVWGINLTQTTDKSPLVLSKIKDLISYDEKDESIPTQYVMCMAFREANGAAFYENIRVFNYIIERYK